MGLKISGRKGNRKKSESFSSVLFFIFVFNSGGSGKVTCVRYDTDVGLLGYRVRMKSYISSQFLARFFRAAVNLSAFFLWAFKYHFNATW